MNAMTTRSAMRSGELKLRTVHQDAVAATRSLSAVLRRRKSFVVLVINTQVAQYPGDDKFLLPLQAASCKPGAFSGTPFSFFLFFLACAEPCIQILQ